MYPQFALEIIVCMPAYDVNGTRFEYNFHLWTNILSQKSYTLALDGHECLTKETMELNW